MNTLKNLEIVRTIYIAINQDFCRNIVLLSLCNRFPIKLLKLC